LRVPVAVNDFVEFEEVSSQPDAAFTEEGFCLFVDSNIAETRGRFVL
jgi:hypothetical protein